MGKFVMKTNEKGSRFVLKAGNGEIIGVSETYSSESACRNGIESVRKNLTGESYKAKAGCLKGIESIRNNAPESPVVVEQ